MVKITPVADAAPVQTGAESVQHYLRPGVLSLATLPPLALYVHIPWCVRKCPYCDFISHVRESADMSDWEAALVADIRHEAARV